MVCFVGPLLVAGGFAWFPLKPVPEIGARVKIAYMGGNSKKEKLRTKKNDKEKETLNGLG